MHRIKVALIAALGTASLLAVVVAATRGARPQAISHAPSLPSAAPAPAKDPQPPPMPHPARWLAFGGGAEPSSNQLSMENDLALAVEALGPRGILLFAGGPATNAIYVRDEAAAHNDLHAEIADLFAPRAGRDARYRRTILAAHGPATRDQTVATLRRELAAGSEPLLVYVDCHGDGGGERALDNSLALWGGESLTVKEMVAILDEARRPVRLVMSACFSGGFAEMVFAGGEAQQGASPKDRCGLFATTWDLEATGCDPDPDRRNHEGYAVHFLHALRGRDRRGQPIDADVDRDGRISFLEAHNRARIASRGLDVPTTTSERWLREVAPTRGRESAIRLPEEDAVIDALATALQLAGDASAIEAAARKRFEELESSYQALAGDEAKAGAQVDRLRRIVAGELLSRWPVIDDAWHPAFRHTIAAERAAIESFLATSDSYQRYLVAREKTGKLGDDAIDVALQRAPVERLLRAFDTRRLAGRLKRRGGKPWQVYERLLACERSFLP